MALADAERDRIERWVGPIATEDEASFEAWIIRFGEPEAAALQFLTRRRAELKITPTQVASGSARSGHGQNLAAIDELIGDLVAFINDNLDDLALTPEGEALVASAGAGATDQTLVVDTLISSPRRG